MCSSELEGDTGSAGADVGMDESQERSASGQAGTGPAVAKGATGEAEGKGPIDSFAVESDATPEGADLALSGEETVQTDAARGERGPGGLPESGAMTGEAEEDAPGDEASPVEADTVESLQDGASVTERSDSGPINLASSETEGAADPAQMEEAPIAESQDSSGTVETMEVLESSVGPESEEAGPADAAKVSPVQDVRPEQEEKKRRRLLTTLLALLFLLIVAGTTFWRYLRQPTPLPELLPVPVRLNYAPHYLFSIHGVEKPVGVALSPQADRIYVTETGGERLVKAFGRDGVSLGSFAPPRTGPAERSPVYVAVDDRGWVFITDRLQQAVFVYDGAGSYLDTILGPDLSLSEYVAAHVTDLDPGAALAYDSFESAVYYREPSGSEQTLPPPDPADWAPLGIRVDSGGNLLLTDVLGDHHAVRQISDGVLSAASLQEFDPPEVAFGSCGSDDGQFWFPNAAVVDSLDRIYVTDGNNGRISDWDRLGKFLFCFGQGAGEAALGLPRGAAIDTRDRLHVVDTVGQNVKVYDVSGSGARFLFAFGEWGTGDGEFNFPNDIALDATGRLYVADRENDGIQVWSY
jgi:DNA-binding beta-propeller fold protein YncE